jgi:hypothetical protein
MLHVGYVHLVKPSIFIRDKPILSLQKDYNFKGSIEKKNLVVSLKELGAKKN